MAVVNIGRSPSVVENGERRVEAHLVDFEGDIYNQEITLRLLFHLREERKFPSREALVEQIARDKQEAVALLTDAKNI
jgi:riboflavin kinase/FMN adenylyltransferase